MKLLVSLLAAALCLSGCTTMRTEGGVPIDTTYTAKGQDSRALFLVLHYTVSDLKQSIKILTEQEVSAHYLLTDEATPRIYRLVDENRRAWHSGASAWGPNARLNSASIGIEIVHPGFKPGSPNGPDETREFAPFPQAQIDALIPLVKDIVARHQIKPQYILGHGEVSPSYKIDPGPTFPWKLFADLGITPPWPDAAQVAAQRALYDMQLPDVLWVQTALAKHGYNIQRTGVMDKQTQRVVMNFQMRYRPAKYDGQIDAESAAILGVLTQTAPPPPPPVLPPPAAPSAPSVPPPQPVAAPQ